MILLFVTSLEEERIGEAATDAGRSLLSSD